MKGVTYIMQNILRYWGTVEIVISACIFTGVAQATPLVDKVIYQGASIVQGAIVTVTGTGFDEKLQPMPIMYDLTDKAYLNGVLNNHQSSFAEGQAVLRSNMDVNSLWAKPSNNSVTSKAPTVTYAMPHRNVHINSHYKFEGPNSFLGWPVVYGGSETPLNNNQLYVSWWYKPLYDPKYYWRWNLSNIQGNFIAGAGPFQPGEKIILNANILGSIDGQVIWLEGNELHFVANGAAAATHLRGVTITGVSSGATAVLSDNDTQFISPGSNKFIRIWEESTGKDGLRTSWTQQQVTHLKPDGVALTTYKYPSLIINGWNHLEVEIDLATDRFRSWVNSELLYDMDISLAMQNDSAFSPTIASLGFNGKNQTYQRVELSEIYMDKELQRIFIGDALIWADVTHAEIQLPTSWSDIEIKFDANLGAFNGIDNAMSIYVFDKNGLVNSTGISICPSCPPRSKKIPVDVR
jgi:hypothetical protein